MRTRAESPWMRLALVLPLACCAAGPRSAAAATVTITCGSTGRELELCREGANAWAALRGHAVKLVTMPGADTLTLTQQLLAAGAADIDVFQIDIAWSGILAQHLHDLGGAAGGRLAGHFPAMARSATVGGRLVGMPWFGDAGLLYYRKDLLDKYGQSPPATWAQLRHTAALIQAAERARGNQKAWGYVWQGRAYEGLTCNALEWVASHGGGTVVDASGKVTINNPSAVAALNEAASWVGGITPQGVLNYTEEEARGIFQSGNAVFMRNWPYAWSLLNDGASAVRGKVGVAALPAGEGGVSTGTLAGSLLVVNRYSRQTGLAADLVMYLTAEAEQKRRAIKGSYSPTLPALYQDADVLAVAPYLGTLRAAMAGATARPSSATGAKYNRVSIEFSNAVHAVLAGQDEAGHRLDVLDKKLRRLRRGGQW
ncbi:ABC transporter substrate-binding protein [Pseudoduganella namucuonensis]|uniref:Carbohydrate ABC transporter substrate-binding protein, CUT1 family n=1 Tax=Pseudoduganella namucuonensis TaxID=1035707 RepID=A0A1I7JX88_9BURK|nr:ABC transporter substrate-binding protein [Pseudoduganella namucuonensis]SFU89797.1 carbohydrate ABC transporter substrate-binding protein, CUT1 family [Pseudoduganella namucuonensis]